MAQPLAEFERKTLYSVVEVALITGRPPGLVRRWIYRGQLPCIRLGDESPFVPFDALTERLERLAWKRRRRATKARQMKRERTAGVG